MHVLCVIEISKLVEDIDQVLSTQSRKCMLTCNDLECNVKPFLHLISNSEQPTLHSLVRG